MAKLTLTDITTSLTPQVYNDNNAAIEAAIENTLSRDGTTPNQMDADLDMNSYDVNNIEITRTARLFLNGVEVTGVVPSGSLSLNGLVDVDTTGVTDGQVITYDSGTSTWLAGDAASAIADLTDVTLTALGANEILKYNGTVWVNNTLAEAGIAAASHTHVEADITDLQAYLLDAPSDGSTYGRNNGAWVVASTSPAGSSNEIQYNNAGSFGADPFLSVDLTATSGQAPTLVLDGTSGSYRYPTLLLNYDLSDYGSIEFEEEGIAKGTIRYFASQSGLFDNFELENLNNANTDTEGAMTFKTRSGTSRIAKLQLNRNGTQILYGGLELVDTASAPHTDRAGYGQIFLRSSDNLLIFRNSSGTEYDLTGITPASSTIVSGTSPYFGWEETDGALDQKNWRVTANAEALESSLWDDAETNSHVWQTVQRSGTGVNVTADSIQWDLGASTTYNFGTTIADFGVASIDLGVTPSSQTRFTSSSGNLSITIENGGNIEILDGNTSNTQRFLFDVDLGDLQMDGNLDLAYIDNYAGTPTDGQVLTWVTGSGRAEFKASTGGIDTDDLFMLMGA